LQREAIWEITFTIVTEAHLGLAKTNGVFSLANSIELLELGLVDALKVLQTSVCTLDLNFWLNSRQIVAQ